MLWQPALPEPYVRMAPGDLAAAISQRRAELADQLVILGHHYQTDDVIRHADHTGDSLKLSQIAAGRLGGASSTISQRPGQRGAREFAPARMYRVAFLISVHANSLPNFLRKR